MPKAISVLKHKKMKKSHILVLFLFVSTITYGQELLQVKGTVVDNDAERKVYLLKRSSGSAPIVIDSTQLRDNEFQFRREIYEPDFYTIRINGISGGIQFVWDGNLEVVGSRDSIWNSVFSGSQATSMWLAHQQQYIDPLRSELINLSQKLQAAGARGDTVEFEKVSKDQQALLANGRDFDLAYIDENPDSFVSLNMLDHHAKKIGVDHTAEILRNLQPYWHQHSLYQSLHKWTKNKVTLKEGMPAPAFSIQTLEGKQISLSSMQAEYILLDFWGTWCGPCIEAIPELRQIHSGYKDKSFELISIACEVGDDETKMSRKVRSFISKKEMNWTHTIENKSNAGAENSLIYQYGIDVYPTTILIGPEREIMYIGTGKSGLEQLKTILQDNLKE